ncbi:uncharacterized protein JCM10292_005175 [Rhodotorula paludigena]|uniref:uncharacterized protein n=1 Tax=Rhodotorula paludigena TaxID=86838 RepID=UPI003175DF3E
MFRGRVLPLNVQALIWSYLPPATAPRVCRRVARPGAVPCARLSSTVSLSLSPDDLRRMSAPTQEPHDPPTHFTSNQQLAEAVFEDRSSEYDNVPLSTLDHPVVPRSPDDALLALLHAGNFDEARRLLHELRGSGQTIAKRHGFSLAAHRAAKEGDILATNEHGKHDWLEWWELVPGISDTAHPEVRNLRAVDANLAKNAFQLVRRVLAVVQERTVELNDGAPTLERVNALLEEFALRLCRQGYLHVVAKEVLPHLAAYGSVEAAERIFARALEDSQTHSRTFVAQGAYTSYRNRSSLQRADSRRRLEHRDLLMQSWFANRQKAAYDLLVRARARAILALANVGRLDTAVDLVVTTDTYRRLVRGSNAPVKLPRNVYLTLLALTARRDQFDLFKRLYDSLARGQRRLTRTRSTQLRQRTPYLIRGSAFDPPDAAPSAREAFTSWRYQNAVLSFEEGPSASAELHDVDDLLDLEHREAFADSVRENKRAVLLLSLVEQDTDGSQLARSAVVLSEGLSRVNLEPLPSANAIARWIEHAQDLAQTSPDAAELLLTLKLQSRLRDSTRKAWAVATMLAELRRGDFVRVLEVYKDSFDVVALPHAAQQVLRHATRDRRAAPDLSSPRAGSDGVPSVYAVSVLMQALVALLEERIRTASTRGKADEARDLIARVFEGIVNGEVTAIRSLRREQDNAIERASARSAGDEHEHESTPPTLEHLDGHTFTPFLKHHLRERMPALDLARLVASLVERGVQMQSPHYSILLNALANSGETRDLLYLVSHFEGTFASPDASTAGPLQPSPELESLVHALRLRKQPLSVHSYTGIFVGLRRRGLRAQALELLQDAMERRADDVKAWMKTDERFKREMLLLASAAGTSRENGAV